MIAKIPFLHASASPHTARLGRGRRGQAAHHLRSRRACDRLILTTINLAIQTSLCSFEKRSLARILQSPIALHVMAADSRTDATLIPRPRAKPLQKPSVACMLLNLHLASLPSPLIAAFGASQGCLLSKTDAAYQPAWRWPPLCRSSLSRLAKAFSLSNLVIAPRLRNGR
jgi:hypothetical protein